MGKRGELDLLASEKKKARTHDEEICDLRSSLTTESYSCCSNSGGSTPILRKGKEEGRKEFGRVSFRGDGLAEVSPL